MEFTLYYHGELLSNGSPKHKHAIRKVFHRQLRVLWQQRPLSQYADYLSEKGEISLLAPQGNYQFASLVCEKLHLVAELEIFLLQPSEPGKIITQGADIDNRLKTLFDAPQKPDNNQTPDDSPQEDEQPFLCALENDRLITAVNIRTGRLLESVEKSNEVRLFITVQLKTAQTIWHNIGLG